MPDASLTVDQKLDLIESSGWPIAFDGCHKIYFLEDEGRVAEAREIGYDILTSAEVKNAWETSCGLRFVTRWGYDNSDFEHPWNIEQFEGEE